MRDDLPEMKSTLYTLSAESGRLLLSPHGTMLRAREFLEAAEFLRLRSDRFSPVGGFLACRAVELSLKAFLRAREPEVALLHTHDLTRLLIEATTRGFDRLVSLSAPERSLLISVSKDYSRHRWAYYDISWSFVDGVMPDPIALGTVTRRIVEALEAVCLNLTLGNGDPLTLPKES